MSSRSNPRDENVRVGPPPDGNPIGPSFVVIATYNERENIESMIADILALPRAFHVLIVDDNSPDGTGQAVQQLADKNNRVHLLSRPSKQGYGSACIAGMNEALRLGAQAVFTMDADRSHDPLELPKLFEGLRQYDVALGSRYVGGVRIINWPLRRVLLSVFANRYVRTILGLPYLDCTSGFRGYRREALEAIHWPSIHSTGYAFLVEMLYAAVQNGHRVGEVPITFTERRVGQSKMSRRVIWEAFGRPWTLLLRRGPASPPATQKPPSAATGGPSASSAKWATWVILAAILLLATCLRFHVLAQDPFWVDEIITARTTQLPTWRQVFRSIRLEYAAETPAQIVIATILYRAFGRSVWLYRSIPAVMGVLGVLGTFLLARRLRGPRLGLLAALLLAIAPYNIRYSQEFRGYAALASLSAFTGWTFVRAVQVGRARDWALFGLVCGVSLLFHPFVGFVIVAAGAYSLLASVWNFVRADRRSRLIFPLFCLGSVVALLVFSPWLVYIQGKPRGGGGVSSVFSWQQVWVTLSQLAGSDVRDSVNMGPHFIFFYVMTGLGLIAAFALLKRLSFFLLFWIVTAPLIFWIIALTNYFFSPRQFLYLEALLCVLAVFPIEWICTFLQRRLRSPLGSILQGTVVGALGLALVVPCVQQLACYYVQGSANKYQPLDDMGDFLARNARKDDVVLFDWEPYILEYHCGRKDVQKFSTLPDVWGKGKAIWVGMLKPASPSDPFMTAHPPSARITFQSATLAYYSSATSFSLPHFLSGLGLSKRGAEAGSIGNLWKSISPKSARTFFESVDTSHMNRRTQADFYCLFGNLCRETYFVTNDKEALQKAVELLAKSVRLNPYSVYHFLYYGDALLYAGKLKETCRATEQGIKMARPNDIVQLASNGLRAAELIPDARRVAEFLALVLKYQKDPKTRQATIQKCREYLEKTPKSAGLFRKTFKRHGLDINEVLETQ